MRNQFTRNFEIWIQDGGWAKSKMAAIATNMASKMAMDGETNMATIDNKNGHQYGQH